MDLTLRRRAPVDLRSEDPTPGRRRRFLVVTGHLGAATASLALTCATLAMTASLVTRLS